MTSLIEVFFQHQLTMKMYHFQTKKYGAHKAADAYLVKYTANLDRFMEALQGEDGRLKNSSIHVNFNVVNDDTIDSHLASMINYLDMKLSHDLAAIRDEMIADLQQLRYLLTFE